MKEFQASPRTRELLLVILACWNLAIAYPILDVLSRGVEFFIFRRVSAIELAVFLVLFTVVLPILLSIPVLVLKKKFPAVSKIAFSIILTALLYLIILPGLHQHSQSYPIVFAILILLCCGWLAFFYFRISSLRTFLLFLSPAILIVPALFLFHAQIRRILVSSDPILPHVKVRSQNPIIFMIFDEFPLTSLLNREGFIDEKMYPNFTTFVNGADWYRNATTASTDTSSSIPAILTGSRPDLSLLPIARDYPKNLFTLFAGSHELYAMEGVSQFCPNTNSIGAESDSLFDRWHSLLSDTFVVYLHIILPSEWTTELPAVTGSWGNFAQTSDISKAQGSQRTDLIESFIDLIRLREKPGLFFMHSGFPHSPWEYLPSGKKYSSSALDGLFVRQQKWSAQESAATCAYQRHILQASFTDFMFGKLISKLKTSGMYHQSLVIITSDHGASFRPGDDRRGLSDTNRADIAFVPLFIKRPGQKEGRVLDWNVETIDILPTIAEILKIQLPWKMEGDSVLHSAPKNRTGKTILNWHKGIRVDLKISEKEKQEAVRLRIQRLGEGLPFMLPDQANQRHWINKDINQFRTDNSGKKAKIYYKEYFDNIDLTSQLLPLFISGSIHFPDQKPEQLTLGISINKKVRTITKTFEHTKSEVAFSCLIPEDSLNSGKNEIHILQISDRDENVLVIPIGK